MTLNFCRSSAELRPNSHVLPSRTFGRTSAFAELRPISTAHAAPDFVGSLDHVLPEKTCCNPPRWGGYAYSQLLVCFMATIIANV